MARQLKIAPPARALGTRDANPVPQYRCPTETVVIVRECLSVNVKYFFCVKVRVPVMMLVRESILKERETGKLKRV